MSKKVQKNSLSQSLFQKNYNQLPESKKEILNQKYKCSICFEMIKHENPYFCYECQKIFHIACLKQWDKKQEELNKILTCPNCRYELDIEDWKVLRNYDENRTKDAQMMNQLKKSFNPDKYFKKSINLFKLILNKLNIIHSFIETQKNHKLTKLIEEFQSKKNKPPLKEISTVIIEELDLLEEHFTNIKKSIKKEEIVYKNEINLKYLTEEEGNQRIFGCSFSENNKNNISLIINGKKSTFVEEYYFKKGENNVTICIKNKLTNLSEMFSYCETLYNIDELKYLNTRDITDFSSMFEGCKISSFKALKNWNTSKSQNFRRMFSEGELITNLFFLKNWDVSKCKNFSSMFSNCKNLTNIKSLENWNVSKGNDFSFLFNGCEKLFDIKALKDWNVSHSTNFMNLFGKTSISDIKSLEKWDVSNVSNFKSLFTNCKTLLDITPLKFWNVSKGIDFSYMFYNCLLLSDIKPLENWKVTNAQNFHMLFCGCGFSSLKPLKNWNVSNVTVFSYMFRGCSSIKDLKPLENWNVSNGSDFSLMFADLGLITDISPLKNWDVSKGYNFEMMFARCQSITNRDALKNWKFPRIDDFESMFKNYMKEID